MKRLFFILIFLAGFTAQAQFPQPFYGGIKTDSIWALNDTVHVNSPFVYPDKIQQLETIADMEAYTGESTTVIIKDSLRGGIFNYVPLGLVADNGVVFNASDGGFWQRQYDGALNVLWYGVDPTGVVDCSAILEEIIAHQSYKGDIFIPKGTYSVENMIGDVHTVPEQLMISNDIRIFGESGTKFVVNSTSEIRAVFGFEMGTEPISLVFENIEIYGNGKANRGIYFRHIRDLDVQKEGSTIIIKNCKIENTSSGANKITTSTGISVYGKFKKVGIKNNYIANIQTTVESPVKGVEINGTETYNMYPSHIEISGNYIKNVVRTDVITTLDQDGIAVIRIGDNVENSLLVENNTIKNVRGRFIKSQVQNTHISNNHLIIEEDFEVPDIYSPVIYVGYSDAVIEENDIVILNENGKINELITVIERSYDTTNHRTIIQKNKVVADSLLSFFRPYVDETIPGGYFSGPIVVENNTVVAVVDHFIRESHPSTHKMQLVVENNSVQEVLDFFVYNWRSHDSLNIYAANNMIVNGEAPLTNLSEKSILINNTGILETNDNEKWSEIEKLMDLDSALESETKDSGSLNDIQYTSMIGYTGQIADKPTNGGGVIITIRRKDAPVWFQIAGSIVTDNESYFRFYNGSYSPWKPLGGIQEETDPIFSVSPAAGLILHEQTITAAELTNSGTTPVDLIPAPGAGKIIVVEKVVGFMEAGTTPYDDTGIKVKHGNGVQITNFSGTFSAGGNDIYEQQLPNANLYANQPIVVGFDADQVQGDAVLHLKIYYRIVEF